MILPIGKIKFYLVFLLNRITFAFAILLLLTFMKVTSSLLILFFFSVTLMAQSVEVDGDLPGKPLHSLKTGFLGGWYSYEKKIERQTTLNIEAGLDMGFGQGIISNGEFWYVMVPTLKLEPRWYYNLLKRYEKGKNIGNYSANYLALSTKANAEPVFSNLAAAAIPSLQIIPKWGLRRRLGNSFIFETAIGIGLYVDEYEAAATLGLDIKFGYIF